MANLAKKIGKVKGLIGSIKGDKNATIRAVIAIALDHIACPVLISPPTISDAKNVLYINVIISVV